MKFSLSWLKAHLDTDASLTEITEKLTAIGLELEGLENPADALRPFRVAKVIEGRPASQCGQTAAAKGRTMAPMSHGRSYVARLMRARTWLAYSALPALIFRAVISR